METSPATRHAPQGTPATAAGQPARHYALCFHVRSACGGDWRFPCDAGGHVDLDGLSAPELNRYLFARVAMGDRFTLPDVQACAGH